MGTSKNPFLRFSSIRNGGVLCFAPFAQPFAFFAVKSFFERRERKGFGIIRGSLMVESLLPGLADRSANVRLTEVQT